MKGDCLSCTRLGKCAETSFEKVLNDFTCIVYEPVEEPVYRARAHAIEEFGEVLAVQALLKKPDDKEKDEDE